MSEFFEQSPWLDLPIECPHCGNHGAPDGEWEANAWTPFKLIEEVVRSWEFEAVKRNGKLALTANVVDEQVNWEGGAERRIECMQCFESFPIPEAAEVVFV
jgi:hypothetical protein